MASSQGPSSSNTTTQEFVVRTPTNRKKSYCMMKFATGSDVDFVKLSQTKVQMERENNLKEFKSAYGIDQQPKFGAGSEFGREQREEARRKKFGIRARKYNIEAQPWLMKIGANKTAKKYKGVREGTITENTSYYIFVQCPDGAFEAIPIEEWYNFTPVTQYKYLNSEEAEEEFSRRDKTLNLFNVMLKKRIRNDEEAEVEEKEEKKSGKKGKGFYITEQEELDEMEDDDDDDDSDSGKEKDNDEKPKKKGDLKKKKAKRNAKLNSDDEAIEESDEGDHDDREMDYITDSESEPSEDEARDKKGGNYEEKGVDEETGLKKMIDSDESDEEEKKEENEEEKKDEKEKKDDVFDSDSSSSDSDSDSDIDKSENISAIFMQKKNVDKKRERPATPQSNSGTPRSGTPVAMETTEPEKAAKKKNDDEPAAKKSRTDSPLPAASSTPSSSASSSEGMTEDSIRRYLMRKPMTAKDLLTKFKSKKLNMTNEQMTSTIAQILKKLNPEKSVINKKLYLSLKKP